MVQRICLLLFFIFAVCHAYSQCTVSTGTPIINETFGAGPNFGAPLPGDVTNMIYIATECPNDGQYTIASYTSGCWGNGWHTLTDHTGDPNGYFMLINASYLPNDFYTKTITGLCAGTNYEFSAWVINMANGPGGILPNITFTIEKPDGTVLATHNSGDIPVINPATWKQYGLYFTTPNGISTVVIRMHNNADGGNGNDLAIDDIGFSPAGPQTTITTAGAKNDILNNLCYNKTISLASTVGTCYTQTTYQWQSSTDNATWADIAGATNSTYDFTVQNPGTIYYRLTVSEAGNIENINCRVNSNTLTIISNTPKVVSAAADICFGQSYTLPSGKTYNTPGIYSDTIRTTQGCDSIITNYTLTVEPAPFKTENISICQGQSYLGYTTSGTYRDTLAEPSGCDSVHVINLTVKSWSYSTLTAAICQGQSYLGYTQTGTYTDTLMAANGCDSIRTLNLTIYPLQATMVTAAICQGESYAGHTATGIYIDTLLSKNGCDSIRTLNLTVNALPLPGLARSLNMCFGDTVTLNPGTFSAYLWQDKSVLPTYTVNSPGVYWVKVYNENDCEATDTVIVNMTNCKPITIPNTFSPNNDGINDTWKIEELSIYKSCNVQIFNRYGSLVFSSKGFYDPWDGKFNGKEVPVGTYYYIIDVADIREKFSGWLLLVR